MRPGRLFAFWVTVIAILLFVEVAQLTHLFTLPLQSAAANPLAFVFALVFTTVLALVGAIFIGVYISHRLQSPTGFTPFEEEMLKMRTEVRELKDELRTLRELRSDPPASTEPSRES